MTTLADIRAALEQIDSLPVGHYRYNGFATRDPWVRQRDVHRIAHAALASLPTDGVIVTPDSLARALFVADCFDPDGQYAEYKRAEVRDFATAILAALAAEGGPA